MTRNTLTVLVLSILAAVFSIQGCVPVAQTPVGREWFPTATPTPLAPGEKPKPVIRVAIARPVDTLTIRCMGAACSILNESNGKELVLLQGGTQIEAGWVPTGVLIKHFIDDPVARLRVRRNGKGFLMIANKSYAGDLILRNDSSGKPVVIEVLPLEEYLGGVLAGELPANTSPEAMKAQAVTARTFAYFYMQKNAQKEYDVEKDESSQVYAGSLKAGVTMRTAVHDTDGEVILWGGNPIAAYFHSTCGGQTEDCGSVWSQDLPYLQSVACGFCSGAKHFRWQATLGRDKIGSFLSKSGLASGQLAAFSVKSTAPSGRIALLEARTDRGVVTFKASAFRLAVGANVLRSTIFQLQESGGKYTFIGRGWGHGVGLCQEGARAMAEQGWDYARILKHYYTGVEIRKMD